MSTPTAPPQAMLIVGMLTAERSLANPAAEALEERFGPLAMESRWMPFDFTDYYADEMGTGLWRRLLVFDTLVDQDRLARIKLTTNRIETCFLKAGRRCINLDPGILTAERFVLATGKNYSHRIYLNCGIFADLTLVFSRGAYQPQPWTYPDYAAPEMRDYLLGVRRRYLAELRSRKSP